MVGLRGSNIVMGSVWEPNKVIDIRKWSSCGGDRLKKFYYIYIHIYDSVRLRLLLCVHICVINAVALR